MKAYLDRVIIESHPPGEVNGVALPSGYTWHQARGKVLASNSDDIPVGCEAYIYPEAGERFQMGDGKWIRVVEEWDVIAIREREDE